MRTCQAGAFPKKGAGLQPPRDLVLLGGPGGLYILAQRINVRQLGDLLEERGAPPACRAGWSSPHDDQSVM